MENKIPTAEEFWIENNAKGVWRSIILIEFAKLHVEAALKAANKKAIASLDGDYENGFHIEGPYDLCIDENSILNAYPLTNIK